jgi:hypothetical protein
MTRTTGIWIISSQAGPDGQAGKVGSYCRDGSEDFQGFWLIHMYRVKGAIADL